MPIRLNMELDLSDSSLSDEDRKMGEEVTDEMKDFIEGLVGLDGIEALSGIPRWYITSFVESLKRSPDKHGTYEFLVEFGMWLGARQFFKKTS